MAEQRKYRKYKLCNGLLDMNLKRIKLFFALVTVLSAMIPVSAQKLTYSIIKELSVVPVNQNNFSGTDCAFELKIPYIKSENVQAQIPDLQNGVNFVSLRRSEYSDSENGTKIELWLNFSDSGVYRLRSLKVYLNNKLYYLPFEPIVISENPRNILPQLVVTFDDGYEMIQSRRGAKKNKVPFTTRAGKSIEFTVSLQYGVQIVAFNWSVPKNAIFREIERYEITKGTIRSSEFSDEKIPVAKFEWQPLVSGSQTLPDVHIVATSYNGVRVDLYLPSTPVTVLAGDPAGAREDNYSEMFGYAFSKKQMPVKKVERKFISEENCRKIAELRAAERRSVPFTAEYYTRKEFEESLEITGAAFEPTYFTLMLCIGILLFFVLMLSIVIFLKKLHGIIVFSVFVTMFIVCTIISYVQISATYAIFKGGDLSPVPEKTAGAVAFMEGGKRVRIEQHAGGWVFVQFGNSGGWVTDENVIFIDND